MALGPQVDIVDDLNHNYFPAWFELKHILYDCRFTVGEAMV